MRTKSIKEAYITIITAAYIPLCYYGYIIIISHIVFIQLNLYVTLYYIVRSFDYNIPL